MFLDIVIKDDFNHGNCEPRVLKDGDTLLRYKKLGVGSVVPVHKIK